VASHDAWRTQSAPLITFVHRLVEMHSRLPWWGCPLDGDRGVGARNARRRGSRGLGREAHDGEGAVGLGREARAGAGRGGVGARGARRRGCGGIGARGAHRCGSRGLGREAHDGEGAVGLGREARAGAGRGGWGARCTPGGAVGLGPPRGARWRGAMGHRRGAQDNEAPWTRDPPGQRLELNSFGGGQQRVEGRFERLEGMRTHDCGLDAQ